MDNLVLRPVRAGDGPALRALRLQALADTPIAYSRSLEVEAALPDKFWAERADRGMDASVATWVLDTGDRLVGTVTGLVHPDEEPAGDPGQPVLVAVFLDPAFRGGGRLRLLVDEVAAWARDTVGAQRLYLDVARQNPRALKAYTKLGFAPTGRARPHPLYDGVTELQMVRPLA